MFKTIWSESYEGYPDQEVSHVFLPFIPFVYAYTWLKFYRNGCFCNVPPEDLSEAWIYNNGSNIKPNKPKYYHLFVH